MSLAKLHLVPNFLIRKWAGEGRGFRLALGLLSATPRTGLSGHLDVWCANMNVWSGTGCMDSV